MHFHHFRHFSFSCKLMQCKSAMLHFRVGSNDHVRSVNGDLYVCRDLSDYFTKNIYRFARILVRKSQFFHMLRLCFFFFLGL